MCIGVTYNPLSGENRLYFNELEKILEHCPKENLMGDFNFDLHTLGDKDSKQFEEIIQSFGLFPLISKLKTCIDNILTTDHFSVEVTGTIEESVSHHSSVFSVSNMLHGSPCKD